MKLVIAFIIIAVVTALIRTKKEKNDADFLDTNVTNIAKEIGCTNVTYDPAGHFGTEVFTPCEFLPRCQYFNGSQMLTGMWRGTAFRMGFAELSKDGTNSQGDPVNENITIGRLIEIKTNDEFPVWFGITHERYSNYGIPYESGTSKKSKDYVIKMEDIKNKSYLNTLNPYIDSINKLIDDNKWVSIGFTDHTIYILIHDEFVFRVNKKNPVETIQKEIQKMTEIIDLMCV